MAHVLKLTDGTTTVDFVGSSGTAWCLIEDGGLRIERPRIRELWSGGGLPSIGKVLSEVYYENRDIELIFETVGDDRDEIADQMTSIVRLLSQARNSQTRPESVAGVYLEYQIDTLTNPVYFDVLSGNLELPSNIMSVEALGWGKGSQDTVKGIRLELTCKPLARGAEVTIINGSECENTDDGRYDNYLAITGSDINGDVPGPTRIRIFSGASSGENRTPIWVGIRDSGTLSSYTSILEAEDGTYATHGGSLSSKSVNFSGDSGDETGGYAVNYTLTTSSEQVLCEWSLSEGIAQTYKGRVRAIAVGSFSNEVQYRLKYYYGGTSPYMYKEWPWYRPEYDYHVSSNYALDLGVVDLVPWDIRYGEYGSPRVFMFEALPDDATSKSVRFDAIIFIPAEDYKFRKYKAPDNYGATSTGVGIEDDGIRDRVRRLETAGTTSFRHSMDQWGLPIHLEPGTDARLYVLGLDEGALFKPGTDYGIYLYHTPLYYNIRGTD